MAEIKEKEAMKEVTIFNRGQRDFTIRKRVVKLENGGTKIEHDTLEPGKTMVVTETEAKRLFTYKEIINVNAIPKGEDIESLKKQLAEALKAGGDPDGIRAKLDEKIASLEAQLAKACADLETAKAEIEQLEKTSKKK